MPYDPVKDPQVHQMIAAVMEEYQSELVEHEVKIGADWYVPPEGKPEAPLKLHGYPAAAVVKITPVRQRQRGIPDAIVTIDRAHWNGLDDDERYALLDHEVQHVSLYRDKDDHVVADDAGRPRLRMRLHDVQYGAFLAMADRHGDNSFEVRQAKKIMEDHGFLFGLPDQPSPGTLPFGRPDGETPADVVRDAFAALVSVGHTEATARAAIEAAAPGGPYRDVASLIDAVYQGQPDAAAAT